MATIVMKPRVTSFAPQFLVDDLERSIAYYRKLGFTFGEPWDGFYAIGHLDGLELHLKEAPRTRRSVATGATMSISTPRRASTASKRSTSSASPTVHDPQAARGYRVGHEDFYVEDPDGYIVCFGGRRPQADITLGATASCLRHRTHCCMAAWTRRWLDSRTRRKG